MWKYLLLGILLNLKLGDGHRPTPNFLSDVGLNPRAEYSYSFQPRHVHLAYGANTTEVVATWSTTGKTETSSVNWGTTLMNLNRTAHGEATYFEDATKVNKQYIHRVHLYNLSPNTTFFYQVGSGFGWSMVFGFKTVPSASQDWPLRFAAYGDLGVVNAKSLTRLQEEAHTGMYHLILHVGDFAYNFYENNGYHGDEFMAQIQPIAAYLPYMVCPGNHESSQNFLQYRNRFTMPNFKDSENIFYSFDVGPVHFVSVSTEVYYYGNYMLRDIIQQWVWLKKDLEAASQPEKRKKQPWIVIYGHRPMYCTNTDRDDCNTYKTRIRVGINNMWGMEDLMMQHGVDVAIWAHEHSYERFYPMYNFTYYNAGDPYVNPRAPVHITTGSAGCREYLSPFTKEQPPYSAKRFSEYGYTRFTVANATHLFMETVNATDGKTIDEMKIVKEDHYQDK